MIPWGVWWQYLKCKNKLIFWQLVMGQCYHSYVEAHSLLSYCLLCLDFFFKPEMVVLTKAFSELTANEPTFNTPQTVDSQINSQHRANISTHLSHLIGVKWGHLVPQKPLLKKLYCFNITHDFLLNCRNVYLKMILCSFPFPPHCITKLLHYYFYWHQTNWRWNSL